MSNILQVLEMVLPVLIMIGLGKLCKEKNIFDNNGLAGIKGFISKIAIPVMLFSAFYSVQYTLKTALLFIVMIAVCGLALGAGFLLKRFVRTSELMPFLVTSFEAGMLGYALFALLTGAENRGVFASIDLGQTVFVYTIFLALLTKKTGGKPTVKGLALNMIKNPAFQGLLVGMFFGITGLGRLITASTYGSLLTKCVNFITAPLAGMILIVVGYELSLNLKILGPVFKTILLRILIMTVLLGLSSLVIFALTPFDKTLMIALVLMFSLPSTFITPIYANVKEENEYVSTTLSMNTLVTIAIFILLAFYTI